MRLKAKPIVAFVLLCMMGMVDVLLLVNPNDMVYSNLNIAESEQAKEAEQEFKEKLGSEFLKPLPKENKVIPEKFFLKPGTLLYSDSLDLSDIPTPPPQEILWFI